MVKTLFQASTWNALALGNFDTVISVRELLRCADTGVGIGTALDGVITFENGAAYKTAPDGEVTVTANKHKCSNYAQKSNSMPFHI